MGRGVQLPPEILGAISCGEVASAMHLPSPTGEMETGCSRFGATLKYLFLGVFCAPVSLVFLILLLIWAPFLFVFSSCNDKDSCCRQFVNRCEHFALLTPYCFAQACHPEKRDAKGPMAGLI